MGETQPRPIELSAPNLAYLAYNRSAERPTAFPDRFALSPFYRVSVYRNDES